MSMSLAHSRSTSEERFVTSTWLEKAEVEYPTDKVSHSPNTSPGKCPRDKLLANWTLRGGSALKWVLNCFHVNTRSPE